MRYVVVIYFTITGLIFGWEGVRVITVNAHLGQPVSSIYEEKALEAYVAGDTQKKKEIEDGYRRFEAHLERISSESFAAGVVLCAACATHLTFAVLLSLRLGISSLWRLLRKRKEPTHLPQPNQRAAD